jgi:hypothetical protein
MFGLMRFTFALAGLYLRARWAVFIRFQLSLGAMFYFLDAHCRDEVQIFEQ